MLQHKAYKFRLIPNKEQSILINKTLGCSRLIYNLLLNEKQTNYKNKVKSKLTTEAQYKTQYEFLKEVDSIALQQSRIDLQTSYTSFFKKLKSGIIQKEVSKLLSKAKTDKQKAKALNYGKPKFKSKRNSKNSYRTLSQNNSIRIENNKIKLPKLGFISFKKSREIPNNIKSVTITKNILNKYYISILVEEDIKPLSINDNKIGIDLGIKDFCIDSNSNKTSNPKYLYKYSKRLAKAQKKLSKRKKGSNNHFKQRKTVFKIYEKISNLRNDFLHKLSSTLINENQVISLETLKVKNMVKNHKLSKSIHDCSWSKFIELLLYKAKWYNKTIIQINTFFPSSKLCHVCGYKHDTLELKDRTWVCPNCKTIHDRDINAAINILNEGLRILECIDETLNCKTLNCKTKNRRDDGVSLLNKQTLVCCS